MQNDKFMLIIEVKNNNFGKTINIKRFNESFNLKRIFICIPYVLNFAYLAKNMKIVRDYSQNYKQSFS